MEVDFEGAYILWVKAGGLTSKTILVCQLVHISGCVWWCVYVLDVCVCVCWMYVCFIA